MCLCLLGVLALLDWDRPVLFPSLAALAALPADLGLSFFSGPPSLLYLGVVAGPRAS